MAALCVPSTGLPADSIADDLDPATRAGHTSPSNIAGLLWSAVVAHDLRLVPQDAAEAQVRRVLATLDGLARHRESGMFFNWYGAATGEVRNTWLGRGRETGPFVSSVDNGWLAAALMCVGDALPVHRSAAERLLAEMDFRVFYDAHARAEGGLLHGGFWVDKPKRRTTLTEHLPGAAPVYSTLHHYDLLNSEPRIATYVGIARGQLPAAAYAAFDAPTRSYRGREVVVSLGGSMFEALSPTLFVPEGDWSPGWRRQHADTVAVHREFGLEEKDYGAWGFSPCACPVTGYREFGVKHIAWLRTGYRSEWRKEGVVTPHASALAWPVEPDAAAENLSRLERDYGCYGPGGFIDSVGVRTRRTARRHLALDQAFLLGALGNALTDGGLTQRFCTPEVTAALAPVVRARPWPATAANGDQDEDAIAPPGQEPRPARDPGR